MKSLLIIEDENDTAYLLHEIIKKNFDFEQIFLAYSGKEAVKILGNHSLIDIVVVDIGLPDMSGIECIQKLLKINHKLLVVVNTVYSESDKLFSALKAGANGYILKTDGPDKIVQGIKELLQGGSPMSSEIATKLVNHFHEPISNAAEYKLSNKEVEVLTLLSQGKTYQEIADSMFISISTVKSHIFNTYLKLQVDNRVEAINKFFKKI